MRLQPVAEVEYQYRRHGKPGDDQEGSEHFPILPLLRNNNKWSIPVEAHASDLLTLMTWAFSTLGALAVSVAIWGGKKVLYRLESIETLLASEVKTLRGLALPFARPVARSVMLSKPYQRAMAAPPSYEVGAITRGLAKLDNEELRKLLQASSTGGLLSVPQQ